jgi:hypothetical protein
MLMLMYWFTLTTVFYFFAAYGEQISMIPQPLQDRSGDTLIIDIKEHVLAQNFVIDFDKDVMVSDDDGNVDNISSGGECASETCDPLKEVLITRPGVIILGMHRSGTSALCDYLHQMGFRVGGPLLPHSEENEKGYCERCDVVYQNDHFMLSQEITYKENTHRYEHHASLKVYEIYKETEWFHAGWAALKFLNYRGDKGDVTKTDNIDYAPYLVKDPRFCITLNTWLHILENLPFPSVRPAVLNELPAIVFIYRLPLDVALSLVKREANTMNVTAGLKLWYIYNRNAIQQSYDLCRVVISHKMLLTQPNQELDRLFEELLHDCRVGVKRPVPRKFIDSITESDAHKARRANHPSNDTVACATGRKSEHDLADFLPSPEVWSPSSLEDIALYKSCMRLYCSIEDKSAFLPSFNWDYSIRD